MASKDTENQLAALDNFGPVPAVFKNSPVDGGRFTAGIGMAWPTLSIKGKTFGVRARGEFVEFTEPNQRAGGALMPVQFLDIIILDAGNRISKVFYKNPFVEGQRPPPDCWSADGNTPDPGANDKQADYCRGCVQNVMQSKLVNGVVVRGKACSDNKRLAIALLEDIDNPIGPIMLRLPPGSFSNYTGYVNLLGSRGYKPFVIATRLTFDPKAAHPKLQFTGIRTLTQAEGEKVIKVQQNPVIGEMLNDKALAAFLDPEVADDEANSDTLPPGPVTPPPGSMFAKKPEPKVTPHQTTQAEADVLEIMRLKAELAKAQEPEPEPEPAKEEAHVPTPEQLEIQRLKALLAEKNQAKKGPGRPRSKPVSPPDNVVSMQQKAPVTPTGNGTDPAEENAAKPSDVGNEISKTLNSLFGPKT